MSDASGLSLKDQLRANDDAFAGTGDLFGRERLERVPRGCPPGFEFLPDLDTFYREWLGRPLPDEKECKDLTPGRTREWSG